MKARRLIENATFEPEVLAVIGKAFEEAWREIAHHFDGDARATQLARERLAHACLIVAKDDSKDAARLKREALQVMALAYRDQSFP